MSAAESTNLETPSGATPPGAFKVPNVPKITYQDPQSISTSYGWGLPVDFVLPNTVGKMIDMVLQIDYTVSAAAITAPPTPYWFERLETSLGGSAAIETVNKDEAYQESLAFLDVQDFQTIAPMVNVNADGSWKTDLTTSGQNLPVGTGRLFLPLWANCLMTAQPYLKGFKSDWKLRFTLSQTAPVIAAASAGGTFSITGLRLLITEAQLPPSMEARLAEKHESSKHGIVYKTINRLRHTDTKMPSGPGVQEYTLTTFGNESAGVLVYYRAQDNQSDYSKIGQRGTVSAINLRDAQGNPYYATDLDGNFNLYFLSPWAMKGEPLDKNRGPYNYLLPFSSHVGAVLQDGRDLGAYMMSGKEKVVLTLSPTDITNLTANCGSNPILVAISYDYMRIRVKHQAARVYYQREIPNYAS